MVPCAKSWDAPSSPEPPAARAQAAAKVGFGWTLQELLGYWDVSTTLNVCRQKLENKMAGGLPAVG
jgi:hypothetical protein